MRERDTEIHKGMTSFTFNIDLCVHLKIITLGNHRFLDSLLALYNENPVKAGQTGIILLFLDYVCKWTKRIKKILISQFANTNISFFY